jgi:hypothetical protein
VLLGMATLVLVVKGTLGLSILAGGPMIDEARRLLVREPVVERRLVATIDWLVDALEELVLVFDTGAIGKRDMNGLVHVLDFINGAGFVISKLGGLILALLLRPLRPNDAASSIDFRVTLPLVLPLVLYPGGKFSFPVDAPIWSIGLSASCTA